MWFVTTIELHLAEACCQTLCASTTRLSLEWGILTHWCRDNMARLHFQMHFLEWKCMNFDSDFTELSSQGSNWQYLSTSSDNGLAPTRWQAIIWTNADYFTDSYMHDLASMSKYIWINKKSSIRFKLIMHIGHHIFQMYVELWLIFFLHSTSVLSFLPEASFGLQVLSLPASVCVSIRPSVRVCGTHLITRHPFKLGSPNLDHRCKRPWLRSLLFWGLIDLDLQGQI